MISRGTAQVQITALGDARKNSEQIRKMAEGFYNGEFYVQIGSFVNKNNALRLRQRFIDAGHTTFIQRYYGKDAIYHRVHVYVGKTLQGARQALRILENRGYKGAFVIAR